MQNENENENEERKVKSEKWKVKVESEGVKAFVIIFLEIFILNHRKLTVLWLQKRYLTKILSCWFRLFSTNEKNFNVNRLVLRSQSGLS